MRGKMFLILLIFASCTSVKDKSFWWDEKEVGVAVISDFQYLQGRITYYKFFLENETINVTDWRYSSFGFEELKGNVYTLYYDPKDPKKSYFVDYSKPIFRHFKTAETFCYVNSNKSRSRKVRGGKFFQIGYDINLDGNKFWSFSFFLVDECQLEEILGYWYKTIYTTTDKNFSQLQVDTPYTTKENTNFKIIDIDDKTEQTLNKAARKLNSGGTLYWTTSKIDLSDNAEVNQEELTKMKQFLETYEPTGLFGKKLDVKIEIVDHRNIEEVLIPVEREKKMNK